MQEYQLDFVTYCVGNLADRLNMSASKVYKMLRSTDILNGYMIYPAMMCSILSARNTSWTI